MVGWPPCGLSVFCTSAAAESGARVGAGGVHLGPPVAWAAVRSRAVVLLLLTFCLLLLPLWESVVVLCVVVRCFVSVLVLRSSWWGGGAGCFAWFVFLVSRGGWAALPCGAAGLSGVCDCGIS